MSRRWARTSRALARDMQIIFQDPYASLNPRMTVGAIIGEALIIHKLTKTAREFEDRIVELLETVGLNADHMRRYPHEFSAASVAAHRHRACAGGESQARGLRRSCKRTRRIDSGAGDQPARRSAGQVQPDLHVHRARPIGRGTSATAWR